MKKFLKGPSFLSFAASVKAKNLLNPVVAAPRPRAAARVNTSSREAMPMSDDDVVFASTGGENGVGVATGVAIGDCIFPVLCLLNSSNMVCWSAFLRP